MASLASYIRKLDYRKVKDSFDDSSEDPSNQLLEIEGQCRDGITLDSLKDAFKAFQERVCIRGFPGRHSGPYWAAYSTVCVLTRLCGMLEDDDEEKLERQIGELYFQAWLALFTAGPSSAQIDLMSSFQGSQFEAYIKSCSKDTLAGTLKSMKINFKFDSSTDKEEERVHASLLGSCTRQFFENLPKELLQEVKVEFLDLYQHYLKQLPSLSECLKEHVGYLIRDMASQFDPNELYAGTKDSQQHLAEITSIIVSTDQNIDELRVEETLVMIIKGAKQDNTLPELFPDLMESIVAFSKRKDPPPREDRIYDAFRLKLFRDLGIEPTADMCEKGLNMMIEVTESRKSNMPEYVTKLLSECLSECITKCKESSPKIVELSLKTIKTLLKTCNQHLVKMAKSFTEVPAVKSVKWKDHLEDVVEILNIVSHATPDQTVDTFNRRDFSSCYKDFIEKFLKLVNKSKQLPKLQKELVDFVFTCLNPEPEVLLEVAEMISRDDYIDLSKADSEMVTSVLKRCDKLLKEREYKDSDIDIASSISNLLIATLKAYKGNGKSFSDEENRLYVSIFSTCLSGEDTDKFFNQDTNLPTVYFMIISAVMMNFVGMHTRSNTIECFASLFPEILRWRSIGEEENCESLVSCIVDTICLMGVSPPKSLAVHLPEIVDIFLSSDHMGHFYSIVDGLYGHNPDAVHARMQDMCDMMDDLDENNKNLISVIFQKVANTHPEAFTERQIVYILEMAAKTDVRWQAGFMFIIRTVSARYPKYLKKSFGLLLSDKDFQPSSLNLRASIIGNVALSCQDLQHQAIDYLMKFIDYSDPSIADVVLSQLCMLLKDNTEYFQRHKPRLQKVETTTSNAEIKNKCQQIIDVLEGRSFEDVLGELQQQQESIADLDTKVTATMTTVISVGDKVVEHDKEITDMKNNVNDIENKVTTVENDLEETKVKVEEIDNKTISSAPKWSRDLSKLMNPTTETDWRLLAKRLGYNTEDIRGWATHADPCMALLNEWYSTHKSSEATFGVLTALQEMDRQDGAIIVENAMKIAEDVVEDEDFEYAEPPQIFLSYQWGIQNMVKLLKQHLTDAGYTCWMDIGQMGGGDKLFAKIDNGIRGAKVIISCVTEKYAQSPNCNREVNLSVNLNKPMIPLLMEKMSWPPKGAMGPIFSEYLFIRFFQRGGEETKDQRYWPIPKFQELLMQLNFYAVPDQSLIQPEYSNWWVPIQEEIVIEKKKSNGNSQVVPKSDVKVDQTTDPLIFLSYQWGKQTEVKALYQRLASYGYTIWMDIYQMGGGDSLYDKIDRGMRNCKVVVSCVTPKYALSANCRREISLADALKKPIIPLLLESMKWPPDGPMSMVFTELLYINMHKDKNIQTTWTGDKFDELVAKVNQNIPEIGTTDQKQEKPVTECTDNKTDKLSGKPQEVKEKAVTEQGPVPSAKANNAKPETEKKANASKSKSCNIL